MNIRKGKLNTIFFIAVIFLCLILQNIELTYAKEACLRPALQFNGYLNRELNAYLVGSSERDIDNNKPEFSGVNSKSFTKDLSVKLVKDFFDSWWKEHEINEPEKLALDMVNSHMISDGVKILSLGCGLGHNELFFVKNGASVICLDIAQSAIDVINRKAADSGLQEFMKARLFDFTKSLPFQDESFGVVFAHQSLMYFDDNVMSAIIKEIFRVLQPDGKICISVRSIDDYKFSGNQRKTGINTAVGPEDEVERRFFTKEDLLRLFSEAGFKNIEIRQEMIPRYNRPLSTVFHLFASKDKGEITTDYALKHKLEVLLKPFIYQL